MKLEDIGPILAMAEHRERKEWYRRQREAFKADHDSRMPSDRVPRARQFASQVMAMMQKFIPEACVDQAYEELMITAYGHDVEIVQVPPDRDAMKKVMLDAAMHGVGVAHIVRSDFFEKPE